MRITVRYSAQARTAAGSASEIIELEAPLPVRALLAHLAERHPALRGLLLTDPGEPQPSVLVFIGDEQVPPERTIQAGEVVSILPPIAGG